MLKLLLNQEQKYLRGGAFKPRSSPYSFQGLGEEGLKMMRRAADEYGLLVITEVMQIDQIELNLQIHRYLSAWCKKYAEFFSA